MPAGAQQQQQGAVGGLAVGGEAGEPAAVHRFDVEALGIVAGQLPFQVFGTEGVQGADVAGLGGEEPSNAGVVGDHLEHSTEVPLVLPTDGGLPGAVAVEDPDRAVAVALGVVAGEQLLDAVAVEVDRQHLAADGVFGGELGALRVQVQTGVEGADA